MRGVGRHRSESVRMNSHPGESLTGHTHKEPGLRLDLGQYQFLKHEHMCRAEGSGRLPGRLERHLIPKVVSESELNADN
jgi:hypothetical protein